MIALAYHKLLKLCTRVEGVMRSLDWFRYTPLAQTADLFSNHLAVYRQLKIAQVENDLALGNQEQGIVLLDEDFVNPPNGEVINLSLKNDLRLLFRLDVAGAGMLAHIRQDQSGHRALLAEMPYARPVYYFETADGNSGPLVPASAKTVGVVKNRLQLKKKPGLLLRELASGDVIDPLPNEPEADALEFDFRGRDSRIYELIIDGNTRFIFPDDGLFRRPPFGIVELNYAAGMEVGPAIYELIFQTTNP